jgi:transcription elongation factor GreA
VPRSPRTPGELFPPSFPGYAGERINEDLGKIVAERERQARDLASPPVAVGSRVRVRECETDEVQDYTIVDGNDTSSKDPGRVSFASPVGKALVGRRAGQFATVLAPGGQWGIEVLEVTKDASGL